MFNLKNQWSPFKVDRYDEFTASEDLVITLLLSERPAMCFKGGSGGSKSQTTLAPEQREALAAVNKFILPMIGTGATPYPYPMVAETPELFTQAYERFSKTFEGMDAGRLTGAIDPLIAGETAYDFDPAALTRRWEETFAEPVMSTWGKTVRPMIEEEYNLPGVAHSTTKARGVSRASSEFFGGTVAPTLYGSLMEGEKMGVASKESALNRILPAIQAKTLLPQFMFQSAAGVAGAFKREEQELLNAMKQEFMRTAPEADPWTQLAMGYMTTPTMNTVAQQGYSPWGDIAQTSMAAALLFGMGG